MVSRVRVLALRLLSDDAAAEDVVQEVFASLPRAVRHFRQEVPLETFVLAIALCEVEGLTSAEAATIAAAPEATVRTRLFHARRRLRAQLTGEREE